MNGINNQGIAHVLEGNALSVMREQAVGIVTCPICFTNMHINQGGVTCPKCRAAGASTLPLNHTLAPKSSY